LDVEIDAFTGAAVAVLMVFNTTFKNISVISWQSVSLVEETGVPGETTDLSQVTDNLLSHNVVNLGSGGYFFGKIS
jgi:hypothetical protein